MQRSALLAGTAAALAGSFFPRTLCAQSPAKIRIGSTVLTNLPFSRMGSATTLKDAYSTIQPLIDAAAKYKLISHPYDARELLDPAALLS